VWCGVVWCGVVWCGVVWWWYVMLTEIDIDPFASASFLQISCEIL